MRILAFPGRPSQKTSAPVRDWSTQEVADFYRAHRLLAENGVGIGIDRGLSDEGEPWMVFFDVSTQDVFLHIARIDGTCHLSCDTFGMRLDAADIPSLLAQFEHGVRERLAVRSERAKNVVMHPAARIIMAVSAVFLLFKLENGEAHAKGLPEKSAVPGTELRPTDKSMGPLVRAQSAFARAYDAVEAPAAAAMIAGLILAGELILSGNRVPEQTQHQTADAGGVDFEVQFAANATASGEEGVSSLHVQRPAEPAFTAQAPVAELVGEFTSPEFLVEPPSFAPRETVLVADLGVPIADFQTALFANVVLPSSGQPAPLAEIVADDASVPSGDQFFILPVGEVGGGMVGVQPGTPKVVDISLENIDEVRGELAFAAQVELSVSDVFSLVSFLRARMDGVTSSHKGDHWLFEQSGIKGLDVTQLGVFTGVVEDGSRTTIIGRADIIDDAMSFFA